MNTPSYIPSGSLITVSFTFVGNDAREYSGLGTESGESFMPGFTSEVADDGFQVNSYQDTSLLTANATSLVVQLKTTIDYDSLDTIQSILQGDVDDQLSGSGQARSTSLSINQYQLAGAGPVTVPGNPATAGTSVAAPKLATIPPISTTSIVVIGVVAVMIIVLAIKF
jgi:hypothetical protein